MWRPPVTIELLRTRHDLQRALGQEVSEEEVQRIEGFEQEVQLLASDVAFEDPSARTSVANHLLFSIAATIAAIATAATGLAPIVHRRWLWGVGIVIGIVAAGLLTVGAIGLVA